jgi:hypothetical protein
MPSDNATKTAPASGPFADVAPALDRLTQQVLFGEVWERPGLSKRDRSLITVATLVALYLLSLHFAHTQIGAIAVLLAGRVFLGGAESFVITGALSLDLALGGPLGLASPALGLIASHTELDSVFLVSTVVVLAGVLVALRLLRPRRPRLA